MRSKKNDTKVFYIVAGVVIVLVAAWLLWGSSWISSVSRNGQGNSAFDIFRPNDSKALATVQGGTREVVQGSVQAPLATSINIGIPATDTAPVATASLPADVAIPVRVIKNGAGVTREFDISGENGTFVPSTMVVNEGDIVSIHFTAVDNDYNVFFPDFGVYQLIRKGTTKTFQFQAYPYGEYTFSCKDVCISPATGKLIVNQVGQ